MSGFKASSEMFYDDGTVAGRYTVIPNDVLDKIAEIDLTNDEKKVLFRIIRNTIGYETTKTADGASMRRLSDNFPLDYLVEKTHVSRQDVEIILERLEKRRIIVRLGDKITFNHFLDLWCQNDKIAEIEAKRWKELHEPKS